MPSYWELMQLILPVFALIAIGSGLRRARVLNAEADESLLKMVVNCLYPCLIFSTVVGNAAVRVPANLLWAPLVGFVTMTAGIGVAYYAGRAIGLTTGRGLRTFAFAVGIYNYGYIPIPLMTGLYGPESVGVLLVHNVGCEAAIWTVGIIVLVGVKLRDGWRKLVNPPVVALIAAVILNLSGLNEFLPGVLMEAIRLCAVCAIPLGLILIGATLMDYFGKPREMWDMRVTAASCFLRLGLLPVAFLLLAKFGPFPVELKRVIVMQAAMPAGILSIVIARHYGGQPLTAVQVVVGTTVVGLLAIPLWLKLGLAWVGV